MSTFNRGSYLTLDEYKAAPTALDVTSLVPGGSSDDQDNELAGLIARASRWLDMVARQPLYATQTVAQREETRVDRQGNIVLHARQDRLVSVDALAWGFNVNGLTQFSTPISAWIEEDRALVPITQSGVVFSGSLNFLATPSTVHPVHVQWSYTAGWATTILAAQATAGDTSVTVADPTGVTAGTWITLTNGAVTTDVQVAADYTAGALPVPLTAALADTWPAGSGFTAVPAELREGCVLATSHYIKMRAAGGWAMARTPEVEVNTARDLSPELAQAQQIALRYERRTP